MDRWTNFSWSIVPSLVFLKLPMNIWQCPKRNMKWGWLLINDNRTVEWKGFMFWLLIHLIYMFGVANCTGWLLTDLLHLVLDCLVSQTWHWSNCFLLVLLFLLIVSFSLHLITFFSYVFYFSLNFSTYMLPLSHTVPLPPLLSLSFLPSSPFLSPDDEDRPYQ